MNDDDAALERYLGSFRGDTVEEVALSEYAGKRYHLTMKRLLEFSHLPESSPPSSEWHVIGVDTPNLLWMKRYGTSYIVMATPDDIIEVK